MSQIILPGDINEAQIAARQQAAEESMQEQMFAGLITTVTENVINNLLNCPMGIVYYDENGNHVPQEQSLGFEPQKQNDRDSGYDLMAIEAFELLPGERKTVGLRLGILIQSHMDMFIMPRSGHASKMGITVVNSPGLVDNSYVGYEIKVILLNTGTEVWKVKRGDKIAQARFQLKGANMYIKEYTGDLKELQDKVASGRTGGFGSTG